MSQFTMFSHGRDSAELLVSSGILHNACASICNTTCNGDLNSVCYQVYERVPNGKIIAFRSPPGCTVQNIEQQGKDLVPSATVSTMFDFIETKVNRSFSIHKAAAEVFSSLHAQLSKLIDENDIFNPLIITGNSLGGSIASLYTLWLLDTIYSNPTKDPKQPKQPKRPICVTFGAPLLGDIHLQRAIYERPSWTPCFLHVVWNQDPIPKLFVPPHAALSTEPTSLATPTYMPFGSFLFCSESGCARFDQPDSVFELLEAMSSEGVGNYDESSDFLICYYRMILGWLKEKAICSGVSELGEGFVNPLRVGLALQLEAIGVTKTQQQQQDNRMKSLIEKVEKRQEDALKHKRYVMDAKKKLNVIKKSLANLEWYKMKTVDQGGYYDAFKDADTRERRRSKKEVLLHKKILRGYWKGMVQKAEQMPQKEGVSLRNSWHYAGTNYRRMVEPLDIAYWYMRGKSDYINSKRSEHYKLLEKWFKPPSRTSNSNEGQKASLTEDSCFWARVEEAVISTGVLNDGSSQEKEIAKQNLIEFEKYVMDLIRNCAVSPEIFLENSTFMKWWENYEKIMGGTSYKSLLADYMRNDYKGYV